MGLSVLILGEFWGNWVVSQCRPLWDIVNPDQSQYSAIGGQSIFWFPDFPRDERKGV